MMHTVAPFWKETPFVRILVPFIAGILIHDNYEPGFAVICYSIAIIVIALFLATCLHIKWRYKLRWVSGGLIYLTLIFFGILLTFLKNPFEKKNTLSKLYQHGDVVLVKIEEPLAERKKSFKAIASVIALIRNKKVHATTGKVILYFSKDEFNLSLGYGSQLLLFKELEKFRNSGNPGSMDYERFTFLHGYAFQCFINKKDFISLEVPFFRQWKKLLIEVRDHICLTLRRYIPGTMELGLAEALLIGYKDDLDKDLVRAYSNTGVVHVIAISGLHLGLLYVIFKSLIYPLMFFQKTKWLKSILIIALLWIFSLMTGGSPSVIRSAVMFTAILAGESLTKKISIYNCLAASAFILLCYKPYWLFDIGFQLSYAAVLSIVIFMKPIYKLLFIPNRILDHLWQLCAVTIAAQILTTPVSMYYFHQFPVFFLIANIIAVPLSGIILVAELLLCGVFLLPAIANPLGQITGWLIRFMNKAIIKIDELPFSTLSDIQFDFLQLGLIYFCIISLSFFLLQNNKTGLYGFLIAVLLIISLSTTQKVQHRLQNVFIVYNISRSHISEVLSGTSAIVRSRIHPESVIVTSAILLSSHRQYRIDKVVKIGSENNVLRFSGKNILYIDTEHAGEMHLSDKINLIVVSGNNQENDQILNRHNPSMVVIDATNSFHNANAWKTACKKRNISFHDVVEKGAFVMTAN